MTKDSLMNRWCHRAWIYFGVSITFCMTAVILYFWNDWSTELIIPAAVAALVPILWWRNGCSRAVSIITTTTV